MLDIYLFILPFIVLFKSLFNCSINDTWTFAFFTQSFINNLPFVEKIILHYLFNEEYLLSMRTLDYHKNVMELLIIGGGCLGKAIADTYISDFFKLPMGFF